MLTTLKPQIDQVGGKKICFISHMQATAEGRVADNCPKSISPPLATNGARAFIDRRRGLQAETAQSAAIFKLVNSGLISTILVVLDTVNLQF